jgi:glycosyltransferase XagB
MSFAVLRSDAKSAERVCAPNVDVLLGPERLDHAVNALLRSAPSLSASMPWVIWQRVFVAIVVCVGPLVAILISEGHGESAALVLPLIFAVIVCLRVTAAGFMFSRRVPVAPPPIRCPDENLPRYTVLVPLHRESAVAPALVEALSALDYPRSKLEILFVTEAEDPATRDALWAARPPSHMQIISVPAGLPQTKPRALNYALQFAAGEFVAVYDAEDIPDPGQLRLAIKTFAASSPNIVCLQARLGIYNPDENFLTRQFTLEYAALFEAILPMLQSLGLPILLGGTSNHFRREALEKIGGWDPFNMTEDADLGVRLSRYGYSVAMLASQTFEEAPRTWRDWLGQRTRWLKGWMQTYAVHMRDPRTLFSNLGSWRFLGLQVTLGGMIMSALLHPWFYAIALYKGIFGQSLSPASATLWGLCCFNLAAGYLSGIALGLMAASRSGGRVSRWSALLVPLYWLAISWASYRAIGELYRRPFHWEKTPHSARNSSNTVT